MIDFTRMKFRQLNAPKDNVHNVDVQVYIHGCTGR